MSKSTHINDNIILYVVMRASSDKEKYGGIDFMIPGALYLDLKHAQDKAKEELIFNHRVWIEEYHTPNGIIDVINKTNLINTHST